MFQEFLQSISQVDPLDEDTSMKLRMLVHDKIKKQFLDYLCCCEKNIEGLDLSVQKENISKVKSNGKIHPNIPLSLYNLQQAIKSKELERIKNAIDRVISIDWDSANSDEVYLENINEKGWENIHISHMRKYDQKNIKGEGTIIEPLSNNDPIDFHYSNIMIALDIIKKFYPELYSEIEIFVTHIKIFKGRVLRGESGASTLGAMWIRIPEPEDDQVGYWLEHISHEVSHIRLEYHFFLEELVKNSLDEKLFKAPIRDDLRPMRGIFHATFVLYRMCKLFKVISIKSNMDKRFRDRLQLCKLQYEIGISSVNDPRGKFSENGLRYISKFEEFDKI